MILLNKKPGETPLEAIEKFRINNPEYSTVKLGYAGRLDPMAEGLLLVLVGDECKQRKAYEQLSKTYEFEIICGISTDTYDLLGILTPSRGQTSLRLNNSRKNPGLTSLELEKYVGKFEQPYPAFSAARVNGKPLFYWAREGKLDQITIPKKTVEIYSFELLNLLEILTEDFVKTAINRISKVRGEFRQKDIIEQWTQFAKTNPGQSLHGAKFRIKCSSGTYVRSIAHDIGNKLGTRAIAFSIKRTQIENYSLPSHSA